MAETTDDQLQGKTLEPPERIWINNPAEVTEHDQRWWYENPMAFPTIEYVRAAVAGPSSLLPQGDWQHVQIKAGNPRVVAIQFETAAQATEFINTFAFISSPTPAVVVACLLCGHNEAVNGYCTALVPICSDDYHGTRFCGCKCKFAAPAERTEGEVYAKGIMPNYDPLGLHATAPAPTPDSARRAAEFLALVEVTSALVAAAIRVHVMSEHKSDWHDCENTVCADNRELVERARAAAPADNDTERESK